MADGVQLSTGPRSPWPRRLLVFVGVATFAALYLYWKAPLPEVRSAPVEGASLVAPGPASSPVAVQRSPDPGPRPTAARDPRPEARPGDTIQELAARQVENLRPDIVRRCAPQGAGPLKFKVHLTFDTEGKEVLRSVVAEQRSTQPVSNCIAQLSAGSLRIPPPGANVSTVVRVTIP